MPREHRKRGKKKKGSHEQPEVEAESYIQEAIESKPQWMETNDEINLDAPFGYVDPDVKGYFRTVDTQIQNWQSTEYGQDALGDEGKVDEDKRMFLVAALSESSGKELQLATDPDCSVILERILHSMDDVVIRVFTDRLCGSYMQLAQHRFGSHVCQTLFEVGATTISRETRGNVAKSSDANDKEGVLRTMTILTLGICEELLPSLPQLILDPFAAHVIISLLILLSPEVRPPESTSSHSSLVRSKKSAVYKSRQGSMKSILASRVERTQELVVPPSFKAVAGRFVDALRESTDGNEIRALAANKVANPVLQVMIDIEAQLGGSDFPGSIIDSVLMGAISKLARGDQVEHSDYIETLLRDPTASHLFETLVKRAPEQTFNSLWNLYFRSKLAKLSSHPVANFVVSRAVVRLTPDLLSEAVQKIAPIANKLIKAGRTGVLKALVDQAVSLGAHEDMVSQLVCQALDITDDNVQMLVPCLLTLKSVKAYKKSVGVTSTIDTHTDTPAHGVEDSNQAEPTVQGAVLLQAVLRLSEPHNQPTIKSIQAQTLDDLIKLTRHPVSSRVLDAFLDSPSVPLRDKRKFLMTFIGHYHVLVDDRIGSRVGDRCWVHADPFLKERIARSIMPHEIALSASYYGKYFARNLHLTMLKRDPTAWRDMQKTQKAVANGAPGHDTPSSNTTAVIPDHSMGEDVRPKKRKRPATEEDEIDALFSKTPHTKKSDSLVTNAVEIGGSGASTPIRKTIDDPQLNDVLGAIKNVSKKEGKRRSRH